MLPKDIFLQKIAAKQFREAVTDNFHNDEYICPLSRTEKCTASIKTIGYTSSSGRFCQSTHRKKVCKNAVNYGKI